MRLSETVKSNIEQLGVPDGILYLLATGLGRISKRVKIHKYYVVFQPVPDKPILSKNRGKDVIIRMVAHSDPICSQFPRPAAVIADRFRQGAVCLCAEKQGKFIGFIWLILGQYEEDEVRCLFKPAPTKQVAWDFDVYVDPDYRFGFTFVKLWDAAFDWMRSRGVLGCMSRISAFNPESLRSHQRMGAHKLSSLVFLVLGRFQMLLCPMRPWFQVSFRAPARPTLLINAYKANHAHQNKHGEPQHADQP